jgi:RNA polymerase sigma-70 factor (sigma-E family)
MKATFEVFARRSTPRLLRVAYLLTGDTSDAEDLAQEALVKVYRHWRKVQGFENPEAYLRRTLLNTYITQRRRRQVATISLGDADAVSRDDLAARQATQDHVARALAQLSPRERAAIVLRYYCDFSHAEIADVLGVQESSARSIVSRAHQALKKYLQNSDGSTVKEVTS